MNANARIFVALVVLVAVIVLTTGSFLSSLGAKTPGAAQNYAELLTE